MGYDYLSSWPCLLQCETLTVKLMSTQNPLSRPEIRLETPLSHKGQWLILLANTPLDGTPRRPTTHGQSIWCSHRSRLCRLWLGHMHQNSMFVWWYLHLTCWRYNCLQMQVPTNYRRIINRGRIHGHLWHREYDTFHPKHLMGPPRSSWSGFFFSSKIMTVALLWGTHKNLLPVPDISTLNTSLYAIGWNVTSCSLSESIHLSICQTVWQRDYRQFYSIATWTSF